MAKNFFKVSMVSFQSRWGPNGSPSPSPFPEVRTHSPCVPLSNEMAWMSRRNVE